MWQGFKPSPVEKKVPHPFQATVTTDTHKPTQATPDIMGLITSAQLFGSDQLTNKATTARQIKNAPETRLKFELQGVFISSDSEQSRALLAEKGKPAHLYKKEDTLPGNAVLEDIRRDHVLLRKAGRLETLSFPEKRTQSGKNKSKDFLTYHPETTTTQQAVKNQKKSFYQNPVKAFGEYGLTMDKTADAVRLGNGKNSRMLQQAGLKAGDLIRTVNGKTLNDFMDNDSLVDDVVSSGELSVHIERDGQAIILSLPIP